MAQKNLSSTIEVRSETAEKLLARAKAEGLSVEELIVAYVPGLACNAVTPAMAGQDDRIESFIQWAGNHPTGKPLLSDEAISRESIYKR